MFFSIFALLFLFRQMNSKNTHGADLFKVTVQDNGQIILYDDEDGMLRGTVVLNCQNTTRIKSVNLKFEGKIRVHWSQDGSVSL